MAGATIAYIGSQPSQNSSEPGIAIHVHFVHKLVISAAFPSTVARTAV